MIDFPLQNPNPTSASFDQEAFDRAPDPWDVDAPEGQLYSSFEQACDTAHDHASFTFTAGAQDSLAQLAAKTSISVKCESYMGQEEIQGSLAYRSKTRMYEAPIVSLNAERPSTQLAGDSFSKQLGNKSRADLLSSHSNSSFVSRNYRVIKELGKGSFSRIQLLRDNRSGAARVLKISDEGLDTKQSRMLKNEIQILSALDHPNIVKIFEYSEDVARGQWLAVVEFVNGGDCQQLLASSTPQKEDFIAKLIGQLLGVLCYCHSRGILHGDIKPENLMLTQSRSRGSLPDCKVIDFGLANRTDLPSHDLIGTPSYMAPEIVMGTVPYTAKADIWSVGVTACELLASLSPFGRTTDYIVPGDQVEPVLQNIRNFRCFLDIEQRLSLSKSWASRSSEAKGFVRSLVMADPAKRPDAAKAVEHTWLQKNKASPSAFSIGTLKSMMKFVGSSALMRRCLLIIAVRVGSPIMDQIGDIFRSIDDKHTGHITREALAAAIAAAASCWQPEMDVDDFFDAANQNWNDCITFSEFAATCLWVSDDTTYSIVERVFGALDEDHDGLVHIDDCRHVFRDTDLMELLRYLPVNRAFRIDELCVALGCSSEPCMSKKDAPDVSFVSRFVRSLICSEENTGHICGHELVCQ